MSKMMEQKKAEAKARLPEHKYPEHMLIDLPSGALPVELKAPTIKASDLFGDSGKVFMENVRCGCGTKGKHAHN